MKKEDSAKAEESMPPVWVRKEDKAKALHEDMQRQTFSVWYFTSKIKSPAAQAKPIPGVAPAKPEQLRANRMHVQGDAETFFAETAHVIGIYSWTIQHVPGGVAGPTLARASLRWTQEGWAVLHRRSWPGTSK